MRMQLAQIIFGGAIVFMSCAAFADSGQEGKSQKREAVEGPQKVKPNTAKTMKYNLDFREAPLRDVVMMFSRLIKKKIIVSNSHKSKTITIVSPKPVTRDDAFRLFLVALHKDGLRLVQSGRFLEVVESSKAGQKSPAVGAPAASKSVTKVEVSRSALEAQLSDRKALASQASFVQRHDADGNAAGVKIVGVRSGSLYKMLGIKSGDTIHKINGTKIKNQADVFELLQSMRGATSASLEIERKGKRETFSYQVK